MQGKGVYEAPGGVRLEGTFIDGKLQGQGICTFPSGDCFTGPFVDGKMHGKGTMILKKGIRRPRTYQMGELVEEQVSCACTIS